MSAGSTSRADWLENNYEKIAVLVVLLGLLVSAAILAIRIHQGHRLVADTEREIEPDRQAALSPVNLRPVERAVNLLVHPPEGGLLEQRMWVSELRVRCVECEKPIPYDAGICPFCHTEQPDVRQWDPEKDSSAGDGIPDAWKIRHELDPMDPYLHLRDLDGDGFTVLEEHRAGTNPRDPEDFPPPVMKLRLGDTRARPFMLRFQAVQEIIEGEPRFQLNMRTLERTYFARIGDTVEGFRVDGYDPERRIVYLVQKDRRIALRRGEVQEETERVLRLQSLFDGQTIDTRVGQTFDIRGTSYQVLDHFSDGVRVQEIGGEEKIFIISSITAEERAALERRPDTFGHEGLPYDEMEGMRPPRQRPFDRPPAPVQEPGAW